MQFLFALLALPAFTLAIVLPRQNATLTCGANTLQCCGSLNLAAEPIVANTLGLYGLDIPAADNTIGLNCTGITDSTTEPLQASCIGILSCCATVGLGDGSIAETCAMAAVTAVKRDEEPMVARSMGDAVKAILGM